MSQKILMAEFQDIRFATRALKEIKSLARAGFDIEFLAYDQTVRRKTVRVDGRITCRLVPNRRWSKREKKSDRILRFIGGLFVIARMNLYLLLHRADIYHMHDIKVLPGGYASARLHRGKLVYDAHELHMAKKAAQSMINRVNYYVEKVVLDRVRLCIHASFERAEYVQKLYGIEMPLVLENFASKKWQRTTADLRRLCGVAPETRLLLYVGRIVPGVLHRVEKVVAALPELDDRFHFCLLGPVNDLDRRLVHDLAVSLNVARRVHVLPPVPSSEVISLISTADAGVVPMEPINLNQEYAALNKLSEACMAGLPVIVTDVPVLVRQVLENPVGPCGVVYQRGDRDAFIDAVQRCFLEGALENFARNARVLGEKYYNWENEEKKLLRAYGRL